MVAQLKPGQGFSAAGLVQTSFSACAPAYCAGHISGTAARGTGRLAKRALAAVPAHGQARFSLGRPVHKRYDGSGRRLLDDRILEEWRRCGCSCWQRPQSVWSRMTTILREPLELDCAALMCCDQQHKWRDDDDEFGRVWPRECK